MFYLLLKKAISQQCRNKSFMAACYNPIVYKVVDKVKIQSLMQKNIPAVLDLVGTQFVKNDPVCQATGISKCKCSPDECRKLVCDTITDGVSLVAMEKGQVVGAAVNKIIPKQCHEMFYQRLGCHSNTEAFTEYCWFMSCLCCVHSCRDAKFIMHNVFLIVDENHRGKGIATSLVQCSAEILCRLRRSHMVKVPLLGQEVGFVPCPTIFTLPFTSKEAQRIGRKMKLDILKSITYRDVRKGCRTYADIIEDKKSKCASLEMFHVDYCLK